MRPTRALLVAVLGAAAALGADVPLSRDARTFPTLSELPPTPLAFQDVALASAGLRAAGADLAWVQMLQYSAGALPEFADAGTGYAHLYELALRVVRLDPAFHRAYTYAAGILAWFNGVNRPDQAASLLTEGLHRDPGRPMYGMYIAAIAYKKKGDADAMVRVLDAAYDDPQTSPPMRAILANIHESRGEYEKALTIWRDILSGERDASEHGRARIQIPKIEREMRERDAARRR